MSPRNALLELFLSSVVTIGIVSALPLFVDFSPVQQAHAFCPNPPCTAPRPTTLTLNPIADVQVCQTITVSGRLVLSSSSTGISGETITFTSDNGGSTPSAVDTNTDG